MYLSSCLDSRVSAYSIVRSLAFSGRVGLVSAFVIILNCTRAKMLTIYSKCVAVIVCVAMPL